MALVVRGAVLAFYLGGFAALTMTVGGAARDLGSAVATVLVALTLAPAQRTAERAVERWRGRPIAPYDTMTALGSRLAAPAPLAEVAGEIARAAAEGTGAASAEVWLDGSGEPLARWGATPPAPTHALSVELRDGDMAVGRLVLASPSEIPPARRRLVDDVARAAGPALRAARLLDALAQRRDDRRRQADRLRTARRAVVAAHDAERRRLERDIHDGAQQHVVHLLMQLGALADGAGSPGEARKALTRASATARALGRGLGAPDLRHGLARALKSVAPPGARVRVAPSLGLDPDVESAVYFGCVEALQNATKHAAGAAVDLEVAGDRTCVRAVVRDEGPGFDPGVPSEGAGLANLRTRIEEVGGTVEIRPCLGRGTTVVIEVPR